MNKSLLRLTTCRPQILSLVNLSINISLTSLKWPHFVRRFFFHSLSGLPLPIGVDEGAGPDPCPVQCFYYGAASKWILLKKLFLLAFFKNVATKGEGHFSDKRCCLSLHNQRRLARAEHWTIFWGLVHEILSLCIITLRSLNNTVSFIMIIRFKI